MTSFTRSFRLVALAAASACSMAAFTPAWAQDATFVLHPTRGWRPDLQPDQGHQAQHRQRR